MPAMAGQRVLVVDDDPVILRLLEVNFEMEGYEVLSATDGEEAVRRALEERPDLMVCDIMMPNVNGLEVVERLRADERTRSMPIVLLSAKAQANEIQKGLEVGADEYLTKPFDPLELVERVQALLTKSR